MNFPGKHQHEMNSAVLPCCLWEHRNPNQSTPRQAQHALKYRGGGVHKAEQFHTAPLLLLLQPLVPALSPGTARLGGTASPVGSSHPWDGTWHSGQPARGTARANCKCMELSETALTPQPVTLDTGATPVSL